MLHSCFGLVLTRLAVLFVARLTTFTDESHSTKSSREFRGTGYFCDDDPTGARMAWGNAKEESSEVVSGGRGWDSCTCKYATRTTILLARRTPRSPRIFCGHEDAWWHCLSPRRPSWLHGYTIAHTIEAATAATLRQLFKRCKKSCFPPAFSAVGQRGTEYESVLLHPEASKQARTAVVRGVATGSDLHPRGKVQGLERGAA